MKRLSTLAALLTGVLVFAASDPAADAKTAPPEPLLSSVVDILPSDARAPAAWGLAGAGAAAGTGLAVWGLGSALSQLSSAGGPPVALTITGLAWSTLCLSVSGMALDYLFNGP